ncbi:hypothetical protein JCM8097_006755 [Rhodosporidiobolus ruineniae]
MSNLNPMEQAFLDGTHPALQRNASGMEQLRSASPTRSLPSDDESEDENDNEQGGGGPPFSAVDPDPPQGGFDAMPARPAGGGRGKGQSRNTGVKGVQADYREHLAQQREQQKLGGGGGGGLAREMKRKMVISLSGDGEEKRQDDEELEAIRRKRLEELQGSSERAGGPGRKEARTFGHLREVGMEGFVGAVEEEEAGTAVLVHLYEPEIPPCHYLNQHLSTLARLHPSTKFLRAQASEVEFMTDHLGTDVDTLPTVLLYRGGELEHVWVRFDLEVEGGEVGEGERGRRGVEEVLASKNAIDLNSSSSLPSSLAGGLSSIVTTSNGAIRSTSRRTDVDGDDEDD